MSLDGHILMIASAGGGADPLAERIREFGIEPFVVPDFESALAELKDRRVAYSAVVVPTDWPSHSLKKDLKKLRRAGPSAGLVMVSAGKPPPPDERKKLRAAGLTVALWEPFDEGTLRFQLNRAVGGDRDHHGRSSTRAPTYLLGRIFIGDRTKDAVIYSLSEGGAFLETPRASMDGAKVDVEIRLPSAPVRVQGFVVFANVPGNLQRPNLPLGMGIRFEGLDPAVRRAIGGYVAKRVEELNV